MLRGLLGWPCLLTVLLKLLLLLLLLLLPQCRAWPRGSRVSTRDVAHRRSATVSNATLCMAHLEPTRMRWDNGQVSLTSLKTREASVQECNRIESVCS